MFELPNHRRYRPTHAVAFSVLLLLVGTTVVSRPSQAFTLFTEDFESADFPNWTLTGSTASQDCTKGVTGCSLLLDPACCSTYVSATMALNEPIWSETRVSFSFLASWLTGDSDSNVVIKFSGGGQLVLHMTGPCNNNCVQFSSSAGGSYQFASWGATNTWYQGVIVFSPYPSMTYAELRDSAGGLLGTSPQLFMPWTTNAITEIRFEAVYWGNVPVKFNYDALRVVDAAPVLPYAPRNVAPLAGPGVGEITIGWEPPVYDGGTAITGYNVYHSTVGYEGTWALLAAVGNQQSWTDSGRGNGELHCYRMKAVNAVGEGGWEQGRCVRTFKFPSAPDMWQESPDYLGEGPGLGNVRLVWNSPYDDGGTPVTQVRIYRGQSETGPFDEIASLPADANRYTDAAAYVGAVYYYHAAFVNMVGESPWSNQESAAGTAIPPLP